MKIEFSDSGGTQQFLEWQKLSEHRSLTPEGYLLCKEVPISKVGTFSYRASECGIDGGGGVAGLSRSADELFSPETVASFNGKPVVLGHEAGFATPANWKERAVGTVCNVRPGEQQWANHLIADLLITDQDAINLVQSGQLCEVSCGYAAETTQTSPGFGEQTGIVGNHVALVARARCGHECRLMDGFDKEEKKMTVFGNLRVRLRQAFLDGDEDAFNKELRSVPMQGPVAQDPTPAAAPALSEPQPVQDEGPAAVPPKAPAPAPAAPAPAVTLEQVFKLLQQIDAKLPAAKPAQDEETAPAADPGADKVPGDGSEGDDELSDEDTLPPEEAKELMRDCDTIAPGMKKPMGDSVKGLGSGAAAELMRSALKRAGVTRFGDVDSLTLGELSIAFKAAADAARAERAPRFRSNYGDSKAANTIASIQARADAFWKN